MDYITGILTEKIFALTEGDIKCQTSSQTGWLPLQHHFSKVWFDSITHFTTREPWANTSESPFADAPGASGMGQTGQSGQDCSLKKGLW